jgi:aquaporin Z
VVGRRAYPGPQPHPEPAPITRDSFHWREWSAELAGTALLLIGGLSAVTLDFGAHSPVAPLLPSHSMRLLLTGALFAGTGALIAVSPLGRISGAHLNPAVSLAFWLSRKMHDHDVAAYILAQCIGGLLGAGVVRFVWSDSASVGFGVTRPGPGILPIGAAVIEAVMTAILVLTILLFVSRMRTARWTPLAVWVVVTMLVWQGAPLTGTSLNPARSLGPALVAMNVQNLWVYLVGPPIGAMTAALLVMTRTQLRPVTAKLFHDPAYRSIFMHDAASDASLPRLRDWTTTRKRPPG